MAASAHSASSHRHLLSPNRTSSFAEPGLAQDPSHGQNPFMQRDPTTVSTNDLQFDKVLAKDTDVGEETVYQVEIVNDELSRKARRSELASKKSLLARVWQVALASTIVVVALGAGIGSFFNKKNSIRK